MRFKHHVRKDTAARRKFTLEEPREMGGQLGVNQSVFDVAEIRHEPKIEPERGLRIPEDQ